MDERAPGLRQARRQYNGEGSFQALQTGVLIGGTAQCARARLLG